MQVEIRAIPRAKRPGVEAASDGTLRVKVIEPAEGGRANQGVIAALAEHFRVPKRAVKIVSGQTSRRKRVEIL